MEPKSYREFAASIVETLEALGIEYAIGGSFASSAYGEARTTADIDISIVLPVPEARRFVSHPKTRLLHLS
jgi:predicted nucleotidyltransferase